MMISTHAMIVQRGGIVFSRVCLFVNTITLDSFRDIIINFHGQKIWSKAEDEFKNVFILMHCSAQVVL